MKRLLLAFSIAAFCMGASAQSTNSEIGGARDIYDGSLYPDKAVRTYSQTERIFPTRIIKAGGNNDLAVFSPTYANAEGFNGWSGVIAGSVFCLLAFSGFEAAAPLAEETENPKKNIPPTDFLFHFSIPILLCVNLLIQIHPHICNILMIVFRF